MSVNAFPMVSIVIPVYNGGDYLREAIDSALAQTYKNTEIIVVNDGSDDNGKTDEIARSYGTQIRYICKQNGGVSSALNAGIKNMNGEFFSWLSHDDVYSPDKIEKEINALNLLALPQQDCIIACRASYIDKNSLPIDQKKCKVTLPPDELLDWKRVLHILLSVGTFNGCTLLIPKAVFEKAGMFDEALRFNQDGYMWSKIFLNKFSIYSISDACVKNRIHEGQLTQTGQQIFRKDCEYMSDFLIPQFLQVTEETNRFVFEYAKYNAKYGNKKVVGAVRKKSDFRKFSPYERAVVFVWQLFGVIRPALRKLYYKLIRL